MNPKKTRQSNLETSKTHRVAREFCEFLYAVPVNRTFTLWNLQGALRFANSGVPAQQSYAEHLRMATESRFIEPVAGEKDTYRRIGRKKSAYARHELQLLKDKMISAFDGGECCDHTSEFMVQSS